VKPVAGRCAEERYWSEPPNPGACIAQELSARQERSWGSDGCPRAHREASLAQYGRRSSTNFNDIVCTSGPLGSSHV
jgi:hypothetical protein